MNVREIVVAWLTANGYDGLYEDGRECGCECDDLMPCDSDGIGYCHPGIKTGCPDPDDCEFNDRPGHFHIVEREPTP